MFLGVPQDRVPLGAFAYQTVTSGRRVRAVCPGRALAGPSCPRGRRRPIILTMRPEVRTFVADGPLPDWDASEEEIDRRVRQLEAIAPPVTGEEARALVACFGPDDCYGVAWTLLHLVETGPHAVLAEDPGPEASAWHRRLHRRAAG